MKILFLLLLVPLSLFASKAFISPAELKSKLNNKNIVLIDVTDEATYNKGHIPNAVRVNASGLREDIKTYKVLKSPSEIQKIVRSLGVNNDSEIIIYGHDKIKEIIKSSYVALALIANGAKNISILNGGYAEWTFEYSDLTSTENVKPKEGNFVSNFNPDILVDLNYVKNNMNKVPMIESRPSRYYFGDAHSKGVKRLGHIPHAMTSFWGDKFNQDKTVIAKKELKSIYFKRHNLNPEEPVIIYCTGGLEASMNWYIAYQVLGFKKAKLYDASMREWGNLEDTPLETNCRSKHEHEHGHEHVHK